MIRVNLPFDFNQKVYIVSKNHTGNINVESGTVLRYDVRPGDNTQVVLKMNGYRIMFMPLDKVYTTEREALEKKKWEDAK